jgi:uncharacterized protein
MSTTPPAGPASPTATSSHRALVTRPVHRLGRIVRRFPAATVATLILMTVMLTVLAGQAQPAPQDESMLPDMPEVAASTTIAERFGSTDEEVVQIVIRAHDRNLVSADGFAAAHAIETALRDADASGRLADVDGRPAIVTWMFPAQQGLAGAGPGHLDDDTVKAAYSATLEAMPPEQAGMAQGLLPAGAATDDVDVALAFVFLDATGMPDDYVEHFDEMVAIQTPLAEAVTDAPLPDGITAEAFSGVLLFSTAEDFEVEVARLFGGAFAIIVLILAFVYWVRPGHGMSRRRSGRRSAADVLLSMAAIVMAIIWMNGIGVLLGPGFLDVIGGMTEFTQVLPILLIGLGVDYAIHLTSRYREELGAGASVTGAVRGAIGTVGGALMLATVATAVGFLTNVVNPIPTLRDFGVMAAIGIVAAFTLMLTFVPAVRLLLDRRAERAGRLPNAALGRSSDRLLPGLMARTAVLADRMPVRTLLVTLVLAGVGVFGMNQLETRYSNTDFLPDDAPGLATLDELTERFDGGYGEVTDVLVTGDIATAEVHNALVAAHAALRDTDHVVQHGDQAAAHSIVTLLGQAVADGPDGWPTLSPVADAAIEAGLGDDLTLPEGADVGAVYASLAAVAPDAFDQVVSTAGSGEIDAAVIRIQTTANDVGAAELITGLDAAFAPVTEAGAEVVATSDPILNEVIIAALQDSQVSSLAITLLVAMLLLVAVFAYEQRRPFLGVITIVPVVLVVLWTFGMMAATGIPFGPITATIAALAIGIGLPYSIHVTHRFTEDRVRYAEAGAAIRSTVRHTGGAMAGSALTTMAGFGILVTSSLTPFRQLGAVTVYAVGFSLLAATLVLPSLLVLWDRWHRRREVARSGANVEVVDVEEVAEPAPIGV